MNNRCTSSSNPIAYEGSPSGADCIAFDECPSGSEPPGSHSYFSSGVVVSRSCRSNSPRALPAATLLRGTSRFSIWVHQVWEVVLAQPSTLGPLSPAFRHYLSTQYCWRYVTEGAVIMRIYMYCKSSVQKYQYLSSEKSGGILLYIENEYKSYADYPRM